MKQCKTIAIGSVSSGNGKYDTYVIGHMLDQLIVHQGLGRVNTEAFQT